MRSKQAQMLASLPLIFYASHTQQISSRASQNKTVRLLLSVVTLLCRYQIEVATYTMDMMNKKPIRPVMCTYIYAGDVNAMNI